MTAELHAPGVALGGSDAYFVFDQDTPSTLWLVDHQLGKNPSVTVVDSAGTLVEGGVDYVDTNTLTISFGYAFSGHAYLN